MEGVRWSEELAVGVGVQDILALSLCWGQGTKVHRRQRGKLLTGKIVRGWQGPSAFLKREIKKNLKSLFNYRMATWTLGQGASGVGCGVTGRIG